MTALYDVLFELSNEIRHELVMELAKRDSTMTRLAESFEISLTEASRHLTRLSRAKLIEKQVDGRYTLTPFGAITLRQLQALEFVTKHQDYFTTHTVSRIPSQFVNRLYELEASTPNYAKRANIMIVANNVISIAKESEQQVMSLVDEEIMELVLYTTPDAATARFFSEAVNRGIHFKGLFPDTFDPKNVPDDALQLWRRLSRSGNFIYRAVSSVDVVIHASEKEVSILAFPDQSGRFDYLGFEARDHATLEWCHDVFQYYWERSTPLTLF
jgi:predicted transcriptional regulator